MDNRDKGLIHWQGRPLIEHVLEPFADMPDIIISANQNLPVYERYGYPVIKDNLADFQGPLAGILSAMSRCQADLLLTLPCDNPAPPQQLLERLQQCMDINQVAAVMCHDGKRLQPLYALLSKSLQPQLSAYLERGERRVDGFYRQQQASECDFSDQHARFENFNSPADMT